MEGKKISYEQFIEKYGDSKIRFSFYFKYSFYFKNIDNSLAIVTGGCADDIYRYEVDADKEYLVSELKKAGYFCVYLNDEIICLINPDDENFNDREVE